MSARPAQTTRTGGRAAPQGAGNTGCSVPARHFNIQFGEEPRRDDGGEIELRGQVGDRTGSEDFVGSEALAAVVDLIAQQGQVVRLGEALDGLQELQIVRGAYRPVRFINERHAAGRKDGEHEGRAGQPFGVRAKNEAPLAVEAATAEAKAYGNFLLAWKTRQIRRQCPAAAINFSGATSGVAPSGAQGPSRSSASCQPRWSTAVVPAAARCRTPAWRLPCGVRHNTAAARQPLAENGSSRSNATSPTRRPAATAGRRAAPQGAQGRLPSGDSRPVVGSGADSEAGPRRPS